MQTHCVITRWLLFSLNQFDVREQRAHTVCKWGEMKCKWSWHIFVRSKTSPFVCARSRGPWPEIGPASTHDSFAILQKKKKEKKNPLTLPPAQASVPTSDDTGGIHAPLSKHSQVRHGLGVCASEEFLSVSPHNVIGCGSLAAREYKRDAWLKILQRGSWFFRFLFQRRPEQKVTCHLRGCPSVRPYRTD